MKILRDNLLYFTLFGLWLILGGAWLLTHGTGDAVRFWSNHRSSFANVFFTYGTRLGEGIAFLTVILIGVMVRYRHALVVALSGLTVMGTSFLTKALFAHERPAAYLRRLDQLEQINLVEGVDLHFGATSFPSGHTMAAFTLFTLLALLIPRKRLAAAGLFALAMIVAMSRIYLVQHFMKDVYAGSMIGVLLALMIFLMQQRYPFGSQAWYNRGLWQIFRPSA